MSEWKCDFTGNAYKTTPFILVRDSLSKGHLKEKSYSYGHKKEYFIISVQFLISLKIWIFFATLEFSLTILLFKN